MARGLSKENRLPIESRNFCDALGRFASGVTVITGIDADGNAAGVTVSAFSSLSLEPPLVQVCLGRTTACIGAFVEGSHFTVNILTREQKDVSDIFARRSADKFDGVKYRIGENGCPILPDCLAVLQCSRHAVYDGGDHVILIGRVEAIDTVASGEPLLHFQGVYHRLGDRI